MSSGTGPQRYRQKWVRAPVPGTWTKSGWAAATCRIGSISGGWSGDWHAENLKITRDQENDIADV